MHVSIAGIARWTARRLPAVVTVVTVVLAAGCETGRSADAPLPPDDALARGRSGSVAPPTAPEGTSAPTPPTPDTAATPTPPEPSEPPILAAGPPLVDDPPIGVVPVDVAPDIRLDDIALADTPLADVPVEDVPADRLETLDDRALLRAFDGAPPVIPHEIEQRSVGDCLGCHGEGPDADEKGAPKPPHRPLASCTQCHVEEFSEHFEEIELTENTFQGRVAPVAGARTCEGAPPLIPHTTHMRTTCLSCHGSFGPTPLHSSHPERQNCLQCHGVSATLDQRR